MICTEKSKKNRIITDWKVEKNDFGIPKNKYVAVEVITEKDGGCYLNSGTVFREYEGGGNYGNKKLSHYYSKLMLCENINKTK